jgi:hypothetical protein
MQSDAGITRINSSLDTIPQREDWPALGMEHYPLRASHLDPFEPIGLAQLDAAALMNRTDVKYLMGLPQLHTLLTALVDGYWVLQVEGLRLCRYRTLYFDTEGLQLYASHHMGRSERYKVRSRSYLDSGAAFLEVKHKTNKGRTIKERIRTGTLLTQLTPEANQFVESLAPLHAHPLRPTLWTEFSRITLVSRCRHERVTFDVNLGYRAGDSHVSLAGVVVAEIKQESVSRGSELMATMRALGIHPTPFSKYCTGMAMLYPGVKHNRFKPVLRQVDNFMRGHYHA